MLIVVVLVVLFPIETVMVQEEETLLWFYSVDYIVSVNGDIDVNYGTYFFNV